MNQEQSCHSYPTQLSHHNTSPNPAPGSLALNPSLQLRHVTPLILTHSNMSPPALQVSTTGSCTRCRPCRRCRRRRHSATLTRAATTTRHARPPCAVNSTSHASRSSPPRSLNHKHSSNKTHPLLPTVPTPQNSLLRHGAKCQMNVSSHSSQKKACLSPCLAGACLHGRTPIPETRTALHNLRSTSTNKTRGRRLLVCPARPLRCTQLEDSTNNTANRSSHRAHTTTNIPHNHHEHLH